MECAGPGQCLYLAGGIHICVASVFAHVLQPTVFPACMHSFTFARKLGITFWGKSG